MDKPLKFKKGDYIINRKTGNIGIFDKLKKRHLYFTHYYSDMFDKISNDHHFAIDYQDFFDICTEEEKEKMDEIIKKKNGNSRTEHKIK